MEKAPEEQYLTHTPPFEDIGRQKLPQFKGIRLRKWGSWGSEIRMPKTRVKIWLGSYKTAEQAARAYDAAVYCLRGPNAKFNFPYSVPSIPSASTLSREQIPVAAAKYALDEFPSISLSLQNTENMNNKAREKSISLSRPSPMELSCNSQPIREAQDWKLSDYPFDGNDGLDLEKIPSIDEVSASQLEEQQQGYFSFDTADLWNV